MDDLCTVSFTRIGVCSKCGYTVGVKVGNRQVAGHRNASGTFCALHCPACRDTALAFTDSAQSAGED